MLISQFPLFIIKNKKYNNIIDNYYFMKKAGLIRKIDKGIFILLPLGKIIINNIINIIKKELNKIKCIELLIPILQPLQYLKNNKFNKEIFTLNDRNNNSYFLSPTNENIITKLINTEMLKNINFPIILYQFNTKFRDELRPCYGIIRSREFIMKDAYSFHKNKKCLQKTYKLIIDCYYKIFNLLELNILKIKADNGNIGGNISHEFHYIKKNVSKNKKFLLKNSLELAHVFQLEKKYSYKYKNIKNLFMGCYGIGITRILAALIDQNNNNYKSIVWPKTITPFDILLLPINMHNNIIVYKISNIIYNKLLFYKIKILFDNRKITAGLMFNDMDLLGIPYIIIISNRNLINNKIEFFDRRNNIKILLDLKIIIFFLLKFISN